eukprot:1136602-Pelagomonas_calceolata.AAC.1
MVGGWCALTVAASPSLFFIDLNDRQLRSGVAIAGAAVVTGRAGEGAHAIALRFVGVAGSALVFGGTYDTVGACAAGLLKEGKRKRSDVHSKENTVTTNTGRRSTLNGLRKKGLDLFTRLRGQLSGNTEARNQTWPTKAQLIKFGQCTAVQYAHKLSSTGVPLIAKALIKFWCPGAASAKNPPDPH